MGWRGGLLVLVSLLLMLVLGIVGEQRAPSGRFEVAPTVISTQERGAAVAFELLRGLPEFEVEPRRRGFLDLSPWDGAGAAILSLAPSVELSPVELERLHGWVLGGGTWIVAAEDGVRVSGTGLATSEDGLWTVTRTSTDSFELMSALGFEVEPAYEGPVRDAERVRLASSASHPKGAAGPQGWWPVGDGAVLWIPDDRVFTNRALADEDHDVLLVRLLEARRVTRVGFDEFHLGFGEQGGLSTFFEAVFARPVGPFLLQILVGLLLGLVWRERRSGPVRTPPPLEPAHPAESVAALLRWLGRPEIEARWQQRWRQIRDQSHR